MTESVWGTKTKTVPIGSFAQSLPTPDVEATEGWREWKAEDSQRQTTAVTQVRCGDCSNQVARSGWNSLYFEGRICRISRKIGMEYERERMTLKFWIEKLEKCNYHK